MDSVAAKLRAIRETLDRRPGVREIARDLGYDMPNKYGYYESAQFKKDILPLDKAREFAAVFKRYGGDPEEVLALAGLNADERAREISELPTQRALQTVQFTFAMPNAEALTQMLRGMIQAAGSPDVADELAPKLARRLPARLAQLQAAALAQELGPLIALDEESQSPAKSRRASRQPSHT